MRKVVCFLCCIAIVGCCKLPVFTGKTIASSNIWPCELTFLTDSTVRYFRNLGWGVPQQEALAKWAYVDSRHIRLTTDYTHRNIPIDVVESQKSSDYITFILADTLSTEVNVYLHIGEKNFKFRDRTMKVSRKDLGENHVFSLTARADSRKFAPELNNDIVKTAQYTICDSRNNVFRISLPPSMNKWWDSTFYYQELDHILKIKRCGKKLVWLNPGPRMNR